jgi:serine protease inhibitor
MLVTDRARPVKLDYESLVEKVYDADVFPVNFLEVEKTLNIINSQVNRLTEGQIPDTVTREDLFKVRSWSSRDVRTGTNDFHL